VNDYERDLDKAMLGLALGLSCLLYRLALFLM
jgi:hypothetical protein